MAENFPGPYTCRILYTTGTNNRQHLMTLNCDVDSEPSVGAAFSTFSFVQRDGTPIQADSAVDTWIALIDVLWEDITNFVSAELWKHTPLTYLSSFKSSYSIGQPGTDAVNPTVAAGQTIYTFRTQEGGIMKLSFLETVTGAGVSRSYPTTFAPTDAVFDFVASDSNWILARDTSYPVSPLRWHPGTNEALFKKIYRDL